MEDTFSSARQLYTHFRTSSPNRSFIAQKARHWLYLWQAPTNSREVFKEGECCETLWCSEILSAPWDCVSLNARGTSGDYVQFHGLLVFAACCPSANSLQHMGLNNAHIADKLGSSYFQLTYYK